MDMQNAETQLEELKSSLEAVDKKTAENRLAMIVFSGDMDKVLASFILATGAVAMGMDVVMFFTFWGTPVLRDKKKKVGGKDIMGKMFGGMLPTGTGDVKLSNIGNRHDEIVDEEEKRGFSGRDDRACRGARSTDLRM
jgi:predicted peroxiredoxin